MRRYFVTGTDTEVGKTYTTVQLLHYLNRTQVAMGLKPIAAGAQQVAGIWQNDDARAIKAANAFQADYALINPFCFPAAIAPHLAAPEPLSVAQVVATVETSLAQFENVDICLIEGAGGFLVPLNDKESFADLVAPLQCEVILVVGMRLGCINHALLTVAAIAQRGLKLRGWIANQIDPDMSHYAENIATLQQQIAAPMLTEIRHGQGAIDKGLVL
ncbi:MAG: dethiobiotin synthase [Gammaproteobacteria bacterium]|nr:dethiobiotin synthase [Gammaproteobacteria bacterium]NVK87155.1 dethiobiotin synthase [Gammaproteobacteria bacterium]